jgi:hypothetical protein
MGVPCSIVGAEVGKSGFREGETRNEEESGGTEVFSFGVFV